MKILGSVVSAFAGAARDVARAGFDQIEQAVQGLKSQTEGYLGDERIQNVDRKSREALQKWLDQNPNASESQVLEKSREAFSNAQTSEFINKMFDEAFFSKIMERIKELSSETWE